MKDFGPHNQEFLNRVFLEGLNKVATEKSNHIRVIKDAEQKLLVNLLFQVNFLLLHQFAHPLRLHCFFQQLRKGGNNANTCKMYAEKQDQTMRLYFVQAI